MSDDLTLDDLPQPVREERVPVEKLSVDGDNPNEQSDEMFGLLCENMRKKGWIGNAIVADESGLIADGEHRYRAAQEIGLTEVPVKFYDIDDSERRLWRQELNKISGEHDKKRDALEYDTLIDAGKKDDVINLTNAADEDLDDLLDEIRIDNGSNPNYEYDPDHNVYFEDCVTGMQERLADDSVDMVFTSPPYNVEKTQGMNSTSEVTDYEDSWSPEEFRGFLSDVFEQLARVVKPSGHIFVNFQNEYPGGDVDAKVWLSELMPLPMRSYIVWYKGGGSSMSHLNKHGQFYPTWEPIFHFSEEKTPLHGTGYSDVWEHTPVAGHELEDTEDHPAPFPVDLPAHALQATTSKGDTILDPFMGSGTTAIAAIQNNRNYIGFELDEEGAYKPIIERRIGEAKRQAEASQNTSHE